MSNVGAELAFVLPKNEVGKFPPLLNELDANKKALGISSYGVAVTTLEDVFLRVRFAFMSFINDIDVLFFIGRRLGFIQDY